MPKDKKEADAPEGFNEEIFEKLCKALELSVHRGLASERAFARGARVIERAQRAEKEGRLTRDSEEGEEVSRRLKFLKEEVIGESMMSSCSLIILGIMKEWHESNKPPESLAEALYKQAEGLTQGPFMSENDDIAAVQAAICLTTIESIATAMGHDGLSFDAQMPVVLAEAALQIGRALTGTTEEDEICENCAEEHGSNPERKIARVENLRIDKSGAREISADELRAIYETKSTLPDGEPDEEEAPKKPKKKPKS